MDDGIWLIHEHANIVQARSPVVMDYVSGDHVETLPGGGYVHGDLREPDVLVTTDGLKLIDFDRCGKEGSA